MKRLGWLALGAVLGASATVLVLSSIRPSEGSGRITRSTRQSGRTRKGRRKVGAGTPGRSNPEEKPTAKAEAPKSGSK